MKELNPLEKLDYVLEKTHHQKEFLDIQKELTKDETLSVDEHTLIMILNKLQKDGYVDFIAGERYVTGQQASEGMSIRRNFNGNSFLKSGGYVKQKQINNTELYYKNITTFSLVFGGVAAGIYYIVELLKMLC